MCLPVTCLTKGISQHVPELAVDQEKSFKHTHVEKTDFMFYVFIVIGNVSRIHKLFCNVLFYPSSLLIVTSRLFAIRFV